MSRQATKIEITDSQRDSLTKGYREGKSHCFRMRCLMVLAKADGKSNKEAGALAGQTHQRVMSWVKRFQEKGLDGLLTDSGRGRKRILQKSDEPAVKDAIAKHRQSVAKASAALEKSIGKKVCPGTLRNFLSALAQDLGV